MEKQLKQKSVEIQGEIQEELLEDFQCTRLMVESYYITAKVTS